jgi:hypothetical protein
MSCGRKNMKKGTREKFVRKRMKEEAERGN